jgi:3-hydroxymyristoyl/3-hydroxydecanoyl-(acyl carrier protein) dehydratase
MFFDRILELDAGRRVVAIKTVSLDGAYFDHHYAGRPVMPATLVVEAIAQTAGWLNFVTHGEAIRMVVALVEGVRFHREVGPGDTLTLEASVLFLHPQGVTMAGQARVGRGLVATVERMVFANQAVDPASFTPRERAHFTYVKAATRAEAGEP